MSAASVEYLFLTDAPFFKMGGEVTATIASVRLGTLQPMHALTALGYDARTISLFRETSLAETAVRKAKRIVFGEMSDTPQGWSVPTGLYRRLLDSIDDARRRVLFSVADDHFDDPHFLAFYRDALPRCLAVTAVSERLAARLRELTDRPVYVMPEPFEGARGLPRAAPRRRPGKALRWLARRAGVPVELWRNHLLWFGYPTNLPPLLELLPQLERLSAEYLLQLTLVTHPVSELAALLTPQRTAADAALRVVFVPWAPGTVEAMIATSDFVLIPSAYHDPRRQAKSPNRLVAALHGGRLPVAHPIPAYQPYAPFAWVGENLTEGIRWALRHPGEVTERVRRGQAYIDERHSPDAVARAWLAAFRADGTGA